jgi:hypothetical protein
MNRPIFGIILLLVIARSVSDEAIPILDHPVKPDDDSWNG